MPDFLAAARTLVGSKELRVCVHSHTNEVRIWLFYEPALLQIFISRLLQIPMDPSMDKQGISSLKWDNDEEVI